MSHDPWTEDGNSLDLTDNTENRVHVPFVFTRDHADWLTTDGHASFAAGYLRLLRSLPNSPRRRVESNGGGGPFVGQFRTMRRASS